MNIIDNMKKHEHEIIKKKKEMNYRFSGIRCCCSCINFTYENHQNYMDCKLLNDNITYSDISMFGICDNYKQKEIY